MKTAVASAANNSSIKWKTSSWRRTLVREPQLKSSEEEQCCFCKASSQTQPNLFLHRKCKLLKMHIDRNNWCPNLSLKPKSDSPHLLLPWEMQAGDRKVPVMQANQWKRAPSSCLAKKNKELQENLLDAFKNWFKVWNISKWLRWDMQPRNNNEKHNLMYFIPGDRNAVTNRKQEITWY